MQPIGAGPLSHVEKSAKFGNLNLITPDTSPPKSVPPRAGD